MGVLMPEFLNETRGGPARSGGAPPLNSTPGGLMVTRCDPYGAESRIRLLGGMAPDSQLGRIMWHCEAQAVGRFRMICTGGVYGERTAADGGQLPAYQCPGGHRGQPMPLCADHRRGIARRQAGLCPACAWPPRARELQEALERCQTDMRNAFQLGYIVAAARLGDTHQDLEAQLTEMAHRGQVHRCALRLVEVS